MRSNSTFRHLMRAVLSLSVLTLLWLVSLRNLDARPVHADEANQMVKTDMLATSGLYRYDPTDHHGPLLYWLSAPVVRYLSGGDVNRSEAWMYRLTPECFVWLSVVLIFGLGTWRFNGTFRSHRSAFLAALFLLSSPLVRYYGGYFIQEVMLACFLLAMGVALRYYAYWPSWRSAMAFGAAAAGAICSKETALVGFAAMGLAGWWSFGLHRIGAYWRTKHVLIAGATFVVLAVLPLTDFLQHPSGVLELFGTMASSYGAKALGADGHVHPWYYYLDLLFCRPSLPGWWWREGLMVIPALYAAGVSFRTGRTRAIRFITIYAITLTVLYSLIPYKTPWCAVGFWVPWLLLAGAGTGMLWETMGHWRGRLLWRSGLALATGIFVLCQFRQAELLTGKLSADPRNPWAYAHTSHNAVTLCRTLLEQVPPNEVVAVALPAEDAWPLPWYLRPLQVGFWTSPDAVDAEGVHYLIASEGTNLPQRLGTIREKKTYRLRPGVPINLYRLAP